ncbi:MAG: glycosyltransferase 87 family protein [Chloroflexota bacterium]
MVRQSRPVVRLGDHRISPRLGWVGPIALGVFVFWQFHVAFGWRAGEFAWLVLVVVPAVAMLLVHRPSFNAVTLMALEVLAASLIYDIAYSWDGGLRDLRLYLSAGSNFVAGGAVYTVEPIHSYPSDLGSLPFLYPPPTLPVFGLLSTLPFSIAAALWVAGSVAAIVWSLRLLGLSWPWTIAGLLWPPIEQGLFVGNIAAPSFLLLAMALRLAGGLVLGGLLKPQNGVMALWLLRERAWRSLFLGIGTVLAVVLCTLPFTGIALWFDWVSSLFAYQESQRLLPGLYGIGLGRYLPLSVFLVVTAFVIVLALVPRGRESLGRLGLASAVASPSLWTHGFIVALPAFLRLRASLCWLALGLLCTGDFPGPQLALALPVAAWITGRLGRRDIAAPDELHPLDRSVEPWPDLATSETRHVGEAVRDPQVSTPTNRDRAAPSE